MTDRVDAVVIGAGVVGLACARALARAGKEVLILERHGEIGSEASARNSEVIHAGIYYPPGSLKARLCVEGKRRLYDFCASHSVEHRPCGKLIVATDPTQHPRLEEIKARAEANGVDDLVFLDQREALEMEPELQCTRALWSPSTGIINSHELMLALLGEAEGLDAVLALQSPVASAEVTDDGIKLVIGSDAGDELLADVVVNSAGRSAPAMARKINGMPQDLVPQAYLAKGNYFSLSGKAPFSRLVYPVPEPGGLGVHLTLDLGGQARFGPDVEWINEVSHDVDPARGDRFYAAIRKYWRGLPDNALQPAYSGIRAKIVAPGEPDADFRIQGPGEHGVPGLVNLFGIESPGLTACLAIADAVCESLGIAAPAS